MLQQVLLMQYTGFWNQTPPELAADIAVRGIVLTGGGCLLNGLDELIEAKPALTP